MSDETPAAKIMESSGSQSFQSQELMTLLKMTEGPKEFVGTWAAWRRDCRGRRSRKARGNACCVSAGERCRQVPRGRWHPRWREAAKAEGTDAGGKSS